MAASAAVLKQRWGFLSPWCAELHGRMDCVWAEREEEVWDVPKRRLEVNLPTRGETWQMFWEQPRPLYSNNDKFVAAFVKVREALSLLAAVAHVDQEGWRYLLKMHCGVFLGKEGEEMFEEEIPARFLLFLIETNAENEYQEYVKTLKDDIVRFCGVHQRESPSRAYVRALKRIAALSEKMKPGEPGIDLKIQVQVGFRVMDFSSYSVLDDILQPLQDLRAAEKIIKEEWDVYEQSATQKEVQPGGLRCTLVLGPMIADFHDMKISEEVTQTMETMIQENARFSQLNLWTSIGRQLENDEHKGRIVFSRLMAAIFDSARRLPEPSAGRWTDVEQCSPTSAPLQLGTIHLECTSSMGPRRFEALCSGIVVSQTAKKLSMQLEVDPYDGTSVHWWKWLAYSLFSERARSTSSVESLALISTRTMSTADIEAFSTILASDRPEEELFDCPRGQVEPRDATVKEDAPLFWELNKRGQPRRGSRVLTYQFGVKSVRSFSDDGVSEWVNVLVPGYGRCYVRRADLAFDVGTVNAAANSHGVTDLRLGFDKVYPSVSDGLLPFLQTVGPSLNTLTLDTSHIDLDGTALLRCCPNLKELSLCGGEMMDIRFDFSEYHARNQPLPELPFEWHNISALARDLSFPNSPLAKCVRRLRVFLIDEWTAWGLILADHNRPASQAGLRSLLELLDVNQSLEYLDVVVPFGHFLYLEDFQQHHLKPIKRSLKLDTEIKAAFLSVFPAREKLAETSKKRARRFTRSSHAVHPLPQLDQHVLSKIFAFAAPPLLRKVYVRDSPRNNWEEPDPMPI